MEKPWKGRRGLVPLAPPSTLAVLHFRYVTRRRMIRRLCQGVLVGILLVTIGINVAFILDTSRRLHQQQEQQNQQRPQQLPSSASGGSGDDRLHGWGRLGSGNGERHKGLRLQESQPKSITIEVLSSQSKVSVSVDGNTILESGEDGKSRGIHVLVLHEGHGSVMAQRAFDTYSPHEDEALALFLNMVSDRRLLVFAIKDEGTFQMKSGAREVLRRLGSQKAGLLGWRDMWAMVTSKGPQGKMYGEAFSKSPEFSKWGAPTWLRVEVPLSSSHENECDWEDTEENRRRRAFCSRIEGYGSVCACEDPAPLTFTPPPVGEGESGISQVPVAIIASNRPHYLYRMLRSLLSASGANPGMITVFIDGYFEEPLGVAQLFGLRGIQHTPIGTKSARISQHYKASLTATFNIFPGAKYAIILEEDLDVSPDFFSYFGQLSRLLDEDPSLWCVSAWNDQSYEHTSKDPGLLYRVEGMPGLGWMLKRSLYKEELEAKWPGPEKVWDWDMWMRLPEVRKGRECVVPDVSRTYHFGASGLNMNSYFHDIYFKKHSFNASPDVRLRDLKSLKRKNYEELLEAMISEATVVDHSQSPCEEDFIPEKRAKAHVMYIKMEHEKDYTTWLQVAKCFKIWDLDARGYHHGLWRFHMKDSPILVIGVPFSAYSKHKPSDVTPIYLESQKKEKSR